MYETILSPIHYGGMQLKNRIIFAPTTFGLSDEEYLAKIRAIAQGGCAMIIVGDVPVGKSRFEKSLFDTKGFAFYQQVVKIAHDADCKVCAQLHQSDSNLLAMFKYIPGLLLKKITPDQLREKLNAEVAPYITKMSKRKIRTIISGFGKAAVLAKQAGFDMMQVHGDRMCGSFSSAIFNHRTETLRRNFDFYAPLTLHESGLSPCIHSIMAAQLGEKDLAVAMYKRTARYDLDNINQDSQDGLHITSMSGSWLAIAKGFAGMRTLGGLRFKPFLPDCWNGYSYKFNYRGRIIELRVKPKGVTLTLISGEPISVTIYGHPYELEDVLTVPLEG